MNTFTNIICHTSNNCNSFGTVNTHGMNNSTPVRCVDSMNLLRGNITHVSSPIANNPMMIPENWPVVHVNDIAVNPLKWEGYTPHKLVPVFTANTLQYQLIPVSISAFMTGSSGSAASSSGSENGLSSHDSCRSRSPSPIMEDTQFIDFQIYAAGHYATASESNFQKVLTKLLKIYVHPTCKIFDVCDPTQPNRFKKNMINGIIICCRVQRSGKIQAGFQPDLTMIQNELETKYPLFSDMSLFNEDPLDINNAEEKMDDRIGYANYGTDLQCLTEKINISNFRDSKELNAFLDKVREVFYRYVQSITYCKAVYTKTKKKKVFKTFYITTSFGKNAADVCAKLHKDLNALGIETFRSKDEKKQSRSRTFSM